MNDLNEDAVPPGRSGKGVNERRGQDGVEEDRQINSSTNSARPNPELSEEHQARLDRVISREVQRERGYRTISDRAELMELGFKKIQARMPSILIPMWNVHGALATYNHRPDNPRKQSKRDRFVKYEPIYGSHKILDVPRRCQPMLADPGIDLCITEGAIKVDWIASQGGCGVSIQGVWGWRGTNPQSGKTALVHWASVALNGRNVIIMFDADIHVNPNIWHSAVALGAFLESKDAKAKFLHWGWLEGGESNGD